MQELINALLGEMVNRKASDLYLTVGCVPQLRVDDRITALPFEAMDELTVRHLLQGMVTAEQLSDFDSTLELNTAVRWQEQHRFRLNAFRQQQQTGIVIRRIETIIPTTEHLHLPPIYKQLIMERRGLILVVGPTGSGKTTSMAAMLGHRNHHGSGHVITIEDPIEFVHQHKGCIFTQRDIGIDTYSYGLALKNALRQRPDIVLIGEVRDRDAMEHALVFAETGHLCIATLHANNAAQAIERIITFFPEEKHRQILQGLSFHLKGILAQRLVENRKGSKSVAVETLLNRGLVKTLIEEGKLSHIHEILAKNAEGMITFDQSLLQLYMRSEITAETAIAESDNPANVRLAIKQSNIGMQSSGFNQD